MDHGKNSVLDTPRSTANLRPMEIVRALSPEQAEMYVELRRQMLLDAPWAFVSSPGQDRGGDIELVRSGLTRPDYAIFVAVEQGRLLAAAGLRRDEPIKRAHLAWLWGVYVTPSARGRGLGRAVVSAAVKAAQDWPGVAAVHLTVSERATEARRLYESLGFVAWGVEPDALRVDGRSYAEAYMRRTL